MSLLDPEELKKFEKLVFAKGRQMGKTKLTLPLLRATFPKLIAEELVSVQPMEGVNYGKVIDALKIIDETNKWIEFFKEEEFTIK